MGPVGPNVVPGTGSPKEHEEENVWETSRFRKFKNLKIKIVFSDIRDI